MTDKLRDEYRAALERYGIECAKHGFGDTVPVDDAVRALMAECGARSRYDKDARLRLCKAIAAELLPKE